MRPDDSTELPAGDSAESGELTILHADMDAFFAAVEILDDPSLAGKPLIIGHPGRRGVVSTASYEARRFGVHSALPSVVALRRCPDAVWRSPRPRRYAQVSRQVRDVFLRFTPRVEPLSLDEAFLDVGGSRRLFGDAITIARAVKKEVREATGGLTISVGVAENKFLAKLASDLEKPDGLTVIPPGRAAEILAPLDIRRLWGVGPKTASTLRSLGLERIGDIVRLGREALVARLGESHAEHIWRLAHGWDTREVESVHHAKSISTESTFTDDVHDRRAMEDFLFQAAETVAETLRNSGLKARTVQIKVRLPSFRTYTRAETLEGPTDLPGELFRHARALLAHVPGVEKAGVRLLGLAGKGLVAADEPVQAQLFDGEADSQERRAVDVADSIKKALGSHAITRARLLRSGRREPRPGDDDPGRIRRRDL